MVDMLPFLCSNFTCFKTFLCWIWRAHVPQCNLDNYVLKKGKTFELYDYIKILYFKVFRFAIFFMKVSQFFHSNFTKLSYQNLLFSDKEAKHILFRTLIVLIIIFHNYIYYRFSPAPSLVSKALSISVIILSIFEFLSNIFMFFLLKY